MKRRTVILFAFWILAAVPKVWSSNGSGSGPDECAGCHKIEVESFRLTKHANQEEGCGLCHANAALHAADPKSQSSLVNPGKLTLGKSKAACLHCHTGQDKDSRESFTVAETAHDGLRCFECHNIHLKERLGETDLTAFNSDLAADCNTCHRRQVDDFLNSDHGQADLTCGDCHTVHDLGTVSEKMEGEIEKCLFCHPGQELEFKYQFPHPLREEQITCAGCHDPHSDQFEKMLKEEGDEACYSCHRDIRIEGGDHPTTRNTRHPFDTVGCLDCHRAHGSNFEKVLRHSPDTICSTCHEAK